MNQKGKPKRKRRKNRKKKDQLWTFFYANCRGINSKKNSLTDVLGELNPQIALFTETKLSANVGFKLEGYTFCGKGGKSKNSGGVGILVRDDLKKVITPHEPLHDIEMFWVSIQRENKTPIFCGVYYGKQESSSNDEMKQEMEKLCEEILDKKKRR